AATHADTTNTNIAFTVREISESVPIVATASSEAAVDILSLAGCNVVLRLGDILGRAMAARVLGRDAESQVIGVLGPLLIAEADAGPAFVDKTLREVDVRERANVHIVGSW